MTLTLGEMIRLFREHNGMSMQDFAEKAGITKAYISLLEKGADPRSGKPIKPTIDTLDSVATAMGTTAPDLLLKMGDDDKTIDTYPYKAEIELEAAWTQHKSTTWAGKEKGRPFGRSLSCGRLLSVVYVSGVFGYPPVPADLHGLKLSAEDLLPGCCRVNPLACSPLFEW